MAAGVFGAPLSLDTLIASGRYPKPITQRNLSDYTLKMSTAGGKDVQALQYVDGLKKDYGIGISAKCLIYNATGTTLEFVTMNEFVGHVHGNPPPDTILNGQWGGFLHVHPLMGYGFGSSGAVVYRSLLPDNNDQYCDWSFSWKIPYGLARSNHVYTLIRERDHFSGGDSYWDKFESLLKDAPLHAEDNSYGYSSSIKIGDSKTTEVRGIFKMSPP